MKKVITLVACAVALAWAGNASAEENATLSEFRMVLPADAAACLANCVDTPVQTDDGRIASLIARVTELEKKVADLRKQVGLLGKKKSGADQHAIMAAVRVELERVRGELDDRIDQLNRATAKDYVELAQSLYVLTEKVSGIEGRLSLIEGRGGVKIGPQAGFLVLHSTDGTTYSGFPLGARLTLNLTDAWDVDFDATALLSAGESPIGTQVRGGLGWSANEWFKLEAGIGSSWVGYNAQLKAKSVFVTGDVGAVFSYKLLQAGVSGFLGSEFDCGSPAFAFGGQVMLRLMFP